MIPTACSLDGPGLERQRDRYRSVGENGSLLSRDPRRLVIAVGEAVPDARIDELISVERECCPFFELDWDAGRRVLSVSVSSAADEPALDAIAHALGLSAPRA
jgi:hypothetical protein